RQLEGAVPLTVEERGRRAGEDPCCLSDVDDEEEQWDEERRNDRLRRADPLTQRAAAEDERMRHAFTSCTSPATWVRARPVASRNTSSSVASRARPRRSRSSVFK